MRTRESDQSADSYAYPVDLAQFVQDRWRSMREPADDAELLLDQASLEKFLSTCYHASMLREEERPVTFRAILAPPDYFSSDGRPPEGLQRLDFSSPLSFSPNELRRLSVAADPQRTLIGVQSNGKDGMRIWGLICSGARWLRDVHGGRRLGPPLPSTPVIHVEAPGSIEVYKGYELIGKLLGGKLTGSRVDLFSSAWLPGEFSQFRETLIGRHEFARSRAQTLSGENWASIEPSLPGRIAERMMKRVISMMRDAHHGGTIIFLPAEVVGDLSVGDFINVKYQFINSPSLSFPDLIVDILNRLARVHGALDQSSSKSIGWQQFETSTDDGLATLDEALFETAHLIAGLAAVDGAVVLSKPHELLGFGGMISGRLPAVRTVARALDLEGERVAEDETDNVGARHRSAYRLVNALPGSVAIVISQDGGVRFVCQKDGRVTYWEQE
jgi:hypothetical protein